VAVIMLLFLQHVKLVSGNENILFRFGFIVINELLELGM
jgi:hypothetical protein